MNLKSRILSIFLSILIGGLWAPRFLQAEMRLPVEFVEEKGRVYLVKRKGAKAATRKFARLRGAATVKMTTDEIMALTRAGK